MASVGPAARAQKTFGWLSSATVAPYPPMLNIARTMGATTSGHDGNLYTVGGQDAGGNSLSSVEICSPYVAVPQWNTLAAGLNAARYGLAVVTAPSGKIYAIGGTTGSGALGSVEVYNPANPGVGWIKFAASLKTPRYGLAAAVDASGNLYAIGGLDASGNVLNTVEICTPTVAKPKWTTLTARLVTARAWSAVATVTNGYFYLIGGQDSTGSALSSVEVFNPTKGSGRLEHLYRDAQICPLRAGRAAGPDGNLYAIGGYNSTLTDIATVEMCKPTAPETRLDRLHLLTWHRSALHDRGGRDRRKTLFRRGQQCIHGSQYVASLRPIVKPVGPLHGQHIIFCHLSGSRPGDGRPGLSDRRPPGRQTRQNGDHPCSRRHILEEGRPPEHGSCRAGCR